MSYQEFKTFLKTNEELLYFVKNLGLAASEITRLFKFLHGYKIEDIPTGVILSSSDFGRTSLDGTARKYFGERWNLRRGKKGRRGNYKSGRIGTQRIFYSYPPSTEFTRLYFEVRFSPRYQTSPNYKSVVAQLVNLIGESSLTFKDLIEKYHCRLNSGTKSTIKFKLNKMIPRGAVYYESDRYSLTPLTKSVFNPEVLQAWDRWKDHPVRTIFYP